MGGGRWKKEAQFSPQAPPGQTGRGMVKYWSSVPGRVSSWMESHGFRALRRAKKAKEGKEGSLEEADPLNSSADHPFFFSSFFRSPWIPGCR